MLLLFLLALIAGLVLLLWSADKFVDGGAASAKHLGVPTLLIGILIIGFGTSAPEMLVSLIAALDGNPQLALGNAFGSNITNIALIIGATAVVAPIVVHSRIISKELPLVLIITLASGWMVYDGVLSFLEGSLLLLGFGMLIFWSIYGGLKARADSFSCEVDRDIQEHEMGLKESLFWLFAGIVLLIASSKLLVWGAVGIATALGVSDLVIGLTIVALGTSLPELSSCIVAVKKKEYDLALGNIVGSNMFNILAVIGISATIAPMNNLPEAVFYRDWIIMFTLTITLFFMAYRFGAKKKIITRFDGILLLVAYAAYSFYLFYSVVAG
ncbi:MAG: calcium/sodium antiporter [Sulfurimonadaceae bacterium]